jgi:hypothetical protein
MSDPFAGAARWPIDPADIRLRTSDRLLARFPGLLRRMGPRFIAEPAGSRLRRWVLDRAVLTGFAATDARDGDYLSRIYEPGVRLWVDPDAALPGTPTQVEGFDALRELLDEAVRVWTEFESRPVEIIDLGGRHVVAVIAFGVTAKYSGLDSTGAFTYLYEISDAGRCARQWWTADLASAEAHYRERLAELG